MMNNDVEADALVLRNKAEEILRKKTISCQKTAHSEADSLKAFHELEIQKIETGGTAGRTPKCNRWEGLIFTNRYIELEDFTQNRFILHNLKKQKSVKTLHSPGIHCYSQVMFWIIVY